MFGSKYSKVLTIILIIAIVGIVGILIFLGIDYYRKYTITSETEQGISEFDGYVNNVIENRNTNTNSNTDINTNTDTNTQQQENLVPNIDSNTLMPETNTQTGGNTTSGGSGGSGNQPTYQGFELIGKIEIPKISLKYNIVNSATPKAIEVAIGKLYGPGINEVGNTVLIGHNFRNGTFFSNNKKLELGDKIYLTDTTGKKVTYTITKKYTTGTDDFSYATRDTNGKREISLSTCTDDTKSRLIIWAVED